MTAEEGEGTVLTGSDRERAGLAKRLWCTI